MAENLVTQKNNKVDKQAGRDINENKSFHFGLSGDSINYLDRLYERLELEIDGNLQTKEFIEELERFSKKRDGDVIGLEEKLRLGNQLDFLSYALEVKELYYKKLVKHQFYESAQKINVHLLALVRTYFMHYIYPHICDGFSSSEIHMLVHENIVKRLISELGENKLGFTAEDIDGMLYFLTGNCYIKWAK